MAQVKTKDTDKSRMNGHDVPLKPIKHALTEARAIRFDKLDLIKAKKLNIDVPELCRQVLKEAILRLSIKK